ncbi:unnamed protein product [Somion occarium]|uniref:SGT1-domain-containing protein n=1 Tax=Somion occarium TaxID=3059160 RepID=A0ABP1CQM2_9APHY
MNIKDIFNRPPAISEDTLQYTLYPPSNLSDKAFVTTLAAVMRSYVESLLPDFLWHRDTFQLKVTPNQDEEGFVLEGRMRVGDCVDDEWCAVWLLWQISSKWDVVISVSDSDGEFLLIEAAEHLPSWVTPSNAENRVWIYESHLHLVPLSHVSALASKPRRRKYAGAKDSEGKDDLAELDNEDYINVQDAPKVVRDISVETRAPQAVEDAVWKRIHGYPDASRQHLHHTKAYLPVDVAKALAKSPALIQKAVEAFYTRDAIQLRAAHRMARFLPEPSVLTTVKMTRTAYAQLMGQKFYPPKVFGRWQEREGTPEWRWRDIGMKIACGFEMLYQESKNRAIPTNESSVDAAKSSAEARKEALRRNPDYVKYIENLKSTGYFKNELEGSASFNQLEDKAASAFVEARSDDDSVRPSFAAEVNAALARTDNQYVSIRGEDPDDWLNLDVNDFDAMLEETTGQVSRADIKPESNPMEVDNKDENEEDRVAKKQAEKLQKMAKKVEEFLEGEGDIEGARFQDEEFSDEEFGDNNSDDEDKDVEMTNVNEELGNRQTQQSEAERTAWQEAMDKLVPGIEPSEYGKMPPSFHSHSQRVTRTTIETEVIEEISTQGVSTTAKPEVKRTIRPPILPRDKYEGVDSDDESDEEDEVDSEEEEEKPQVFARQALGVSDAQWNDIVKDRKSRGVFVPSTVVTENKESVNQLSGSASAAQDNTLQQLRQPAPGPRPNANPDLDSFEAVMQAMDAELARAKSENRGAVPRPVDKGKGKAKATDVPGGADIEAAMDAELKAALERGDEEEEDRCEDIDEKLDYNLIKNFLESFKSQGGLSGPVGNLVGRLQPGWKLPRDES